MLKRFFVGLLVFLYFTTAVNQVPDTPQRVRASYYAKSFEGKLMANGQVYHRNVISAASLTYPLGTQLLVKNEKTGKQVLIYVTDRGPWGKKFGIDLSEAAFTALGLDKNIGYGWVTTVPTPEPTLKRRKE